MKLKNLIANLRNELGKFGVIGFIAFLIDLVIFNFLRFAGGEGVLFDRPLTAKVLSVLVATTFAFAGNRQWTFKERSRSTIRRQYIMFFVFNVIGMAISLACLGISHYVLGFESALADNVSANFVGLILGTVFRFWGYHNWVFPTQDATVEQS
ncbi:MAG: GtrA family protein [Candidatus Nanopelagicales bacterium]|nr:GtrA family protein [Candidatus Nanopelagicales bacterium]